MLGMHGARSTNFILQEADLLIVPGARFRRPATGKTAALVQNAANHPQGYRSRRLAKLSSRMWLFRQDVDDVLAQLIPFISAQPRKHGISYGGLAARIPLYSPQKRNRL